MAHDETISAAFDAELAAFSALTRGLTTAQWQLPSLCTDWTVRDVVVHTAFHAHRAGLKETLRSLLTPTDKYMAQLVAREHGDTIEGLVAWLASPAPAAARESMVNVCELVIHQQDVRRPLGIGRDYPEATLRMCLELCTTRRGATFVVGSTHRTGRGLRLAATDFDWSKGDGPEVLGTGEALLMAIARRPAALADLSGPGVAILAERLAAAEPAPAVPA
jgi:uncharacterized protein (TIGR03083 family)